MMNNRQRFQYNAMTRARQCVLDHPITPANPLVTAEVTGIGNALTRIDALESQRSVGTGTKNGAVEEKQILRDRLVEELRDLAGIARGLDKVTYTGVAAKLRVRSTTYGSVLNLARTAIATIEPIEAVFVARGAAATVLEDLEAMIAALLQAVGRKYTGLDSQTGKTAALPEAFREGMEHLRVLDTILSKVYKNDPDRYNAWKIAKRLERRLPAKKAAEPTPAPATGSSNPQP